eukprot:6330932-Pyramimonas_sp.AAC.1
MRRPPSFGDPRPPRHAPKEITAAGASEQTRDGQIHGPGLLHDGLAVHHHFDGRRHGRLGVSDDVAEL